MIQKLHRLSSSQGLIQSAKTIFGNTLATGISAIAIMIYSRILGPEKFGEFSVGFAIVLILTRINDLGLNNAILKYGAERKSDSEKNFIFSFTLKYKLWFSLVCAGIGILFYKQISTLLGFSNPLIIFLALSIGLATVYYEHLLNVLQSLHRFNQGIIINVIQASTKLLGALTLLLLNSTSAIFTFTWYILAPFIPVVFWKSFLPRTVSLDFHLKNENLKREIILLAKHSAVGLIAAGIIENIDILYLQKFLTTYEVGLYSGVSRISLVVALIAYSLGNVLYPRVAKYKNKEDIQAFMKKALLIVLFSVIGFLLFIPFGKLSILLTIGSEYLSGIHILYLLTAASFLAIAAIPFIALFFSFNAHWYFSVSGILQLAVVLIGNTIFVPTYGLEAAAWTRIVTRLVLFGFTFIAAILIYKKNYGKNN